ncbi:hypothetical protein [Chelatococcus asaccharovorans]|uniref:Signaling protein n=1 Tax=Chelatococcus asaccharovorans TaxID=28210 RepID=A0A2V3U904_9HYPH|nr:hypothetical protein [Chelatococcus asaccharovorans]MBS7704594.1 hypothetical protein [Chelatococcus asaccharovorans]PXW54495.1 hypothetical protein C7450_11125 [Chelatococcus asaccharovorans]
MPNTNRLSLKSLLTVGSAIVLVAVELLCVALAGGWALAGLFQLGTTVEYIFMGLFTLLALWAIVAFARNALKVEPIFGSDSRG